MNENETSKTVNRLDEFVDEGFTRELDDLMAKYGFKKLDPKPYWIRDLHTIDLTVSRVESTKHNGSCLSQRLAYYYLPPATT